MSCPNWHKSQPTIMSRPHYILLLFLSFLILFIDASKPVQKSKYAWVSFLYGTSYFNPLRVMQASLRRSGTPYDIVTLVDNDVTSHYRNILELDGTIVLDIPKKISNSYSSDPVYQARFGAVMSKLNMFNMTQYENKMIMRSLQESALGLNNSTESIIDTEGRLLSSENDGDIDHSEDCRDGERPTKKQKT